MLYYLRHPKRVIYVVLLVTEILNMYIKINEKIRDPNTGKDRWEIFDTKGGEGKSGMGIVYLCYDHLFKELVAMKTFQNKYLQNELEKQRFLREAEIWIRLGKHPNIVSAKYVKNLGNKPYIFMEYITGSSQGIDLSDWLKHDPLDIEIGLKFAIHICDGMIHAGKKFSAMGKYFVHRDLKPSNIMITADQTAKITDFGLTKAVLSATLTDIGENHEKTTSKNVELTAKGAILGSPPYMSPEQCSGKLDKQTVSSDIYAFGCVLFEMLTTKFIFDVYSTEELLHYHQYKNPQRAKDIRPDIPDSLDQIILRCIEKKPKNRFSNFNELRSGLNNIYYELTGKNIAYPLEQDEYAWEYVSKSLALATLGHFDEAVKLCDRALKIDPNNAPAYSNKAYAYNLSLQYNKALKCSNQAIKLDAAFVPAWNNRGIALANIGKIEAAMHSFDRALFLDRNHVNAWLNKGNLFCKSNQFEKALECFNQVVSLNPGDADGWRQKGYALAALHRHKEAIRCYNQSLKLDANISETWSYKGTSLLELGNKYEASYCFNVALKLNPEDQVAKAGKIYCF